MTTTRYILNPQGSRASFTAYAPMHSFKGWVENGLGGVLDFSHQDNEIRAIRASADTATFTTGDPERNTAMVDFFHLKDHPETSFTMTELRSMTPGKGGEFQATLLGILEFAGVRRQLPLTCQVEMTEKTILFELAFKWSFKAFGMKVPRLLFLTVRDIVDIKAHLEFIRNEELS